MCLDFANTVSERDGSAGYRDKLEGYIDLVAWSRQAELITEQEAKRLRGIASRQRAEARRVFESAVELREAIYRIFSAIAKGRPADKQERAALNATLARGMSRARIVRTNEGYAWNWVEDETALDLMLWPVARSAAELLISESLDRVRECGGESCGWLFLDTPQHSRKWCDMRDCGKWRGSPGFVPTGAHKRLHPNPISIFSRHPGEPGGHALGACPEGTAQYIPDDMIGAPHGLPTELTRCPVSTRGPAAWLCPERIVSCVHAPAHTANLTNPADNFYLIVIKAGAKYSIVMAPCSASHPSLRVRSIGCPRRATLEIRLLIQFSTRGD